jgi:hypothetical protein
MRTLKSLMSLICALAAVAVFATATPARAQQEPHYLQALTELRTARDYFSYDIGKYGPERHHIVVEINKAIDEIKRAAWDDGKNTKFAGPGQAANGWAPMHYGFNALKAARNHVVQGVDTPQNTGLRERALQHIDQAQVTVDQLLGYGVP